MSKRPATGARAFRAALAITAGILVGAPPLRAQEAPPAQAPAPATGTPQTLEEITITATRRGRVDIQTAPVAVTALSDDLIEALSPQDLGDVAGLVPNFSAGKVAGFNAASFAMRGVGQTSIIVYADAQVGVTVDDFVIPHIQTQLLEMFDIEQIEALRGPQGTLFGKNTTGGVVNVRTKRPELGELGFEFQQRLASFGRHESRFALNVPILGETLAARAAGAFINSDGFYRNNAEFGPVTSFDPLHPADGTSGRGNGNKIGGDDAFSGRVKLLWEPTDSFNATFTYEIIRDDGDSPPVANGTPPNSGIPGTELVFNALGLTRDGGEQRKVAGITNRDDLLLEMSRGHRVDVNGGYLNAQWNVGVFTVDWLTGFREQESRLPSTYTGEVGPNSLFDATRDDDRETFQQEIRVASDFEGPVDFVGGFFYQRDETTFCVLQVLGFLDLLGLGSSTSPLFGLPPDPTFFDNNPQILCNEQKAKNWALFGDVTYDLTDRLTLGGGFRWTDEKKEWRGRHQVFIQQLPDLADPNAFTKPNPFTWRELGEPLEAADFDRFPDGVVSDDERWGEPSGRATISYELSDEVFGYFTYAHGFKSGAYNDQTGTTGIPISPANAAPTDPETADSYELGLKLDLFDHRLRLDLVGFYVKYDDAQRDLVATFTNPFGGTFQETRFFNAAELTAGGIELEAAALITDYLEMRGNFGWIHAEYESFEADIDFDGIIESTEVFDDRDVNRAPEFQAGVELAAHHAFRSGEMRYGVGVDYEDEAIFVYSNVLPQYDGITDDRALLNASISYTDDQDRFFVRFYAHNLTDEEYRVGELPVANLWTMSYYGEPRSYGIEFGIKLRAE